MRVLPTWLGWSAELSVMLPAAAESAAAFLTALLAAAFSLLTRFFSCTCSSNNQQSRSGCICISRLDAQLHGD